MNEREIARRIFDEVYRIINNACKTESNIVDGHSTLNDFKKTPDDVMEEIKDLEKFFFKMADFMKFKI